MTRIEGHHSGAWRFRKWNSTGEEKQEVGGRTLVFYVNIVSQLMSMISQSVVWLGNVLGGAGFCK